MPDNNTYDSNSSSNVHVGQSYYSFSVIRVLFHRIIPSTIINAVLMVISIP